MDQEGTIMFVLLDENADPSKVWKLVNGEWISMDNPGVYWGIPYDLFYTTTSDGSTSHWMSPEPDLSDFAVEALENPSELPSVEEAMTISDLFVQYLGGSKLVEPLGLNYGLALCYQPKHN